ETDRAVEHWFAILVLANLQVRRVGRAFDEVAGSVDHEESQTLAFDLAAEQKGDIVFDFSGFERRTFHVLDQADGLADASRGLEHGRRVEQRLALAGLWVFDAFVEDRAYRLRE